jgi:CHRD domain-containing protein
MRAGRKSAMWAAGVAVAAIVFVNGCAEQRSSMSSKMESASASTGTVLSGSQEVPAVNTQASGVSTIQVIGDKTVIGSVKTTGVTGTAAHIHMAPSGQNGPVIIPLVKSGDDTWSVPGNTVLSSAQFDAFRNGQLYVNVHSAANPGGEIRAQLKP